MTQYEKCDAPQAQQKLLAEMDALRPLLVELRLRIAQNPSSGSLQQMDIPLIASRRRWSTSQKPLLVVAVLIYTFRDAALEQRREHGEILKVLVDADQQQRLDHDATRKAVEEANEQQRLHHGETLKAIVDADQQQRREHSVIDADQQQRLEHGGEKDDPVWCFVRIFFMKTSSKLRQLLLVDNGTDIGKICLRQLDPRFPDVLTLFVSHYVPPTRRVEPSPRASRTAPGIDLKWIGHPSSALSGAALISLYVFAYLPDDSLGEGLILAEAF
ncbi:hypothetical protein FB451DRAFT_1430935 [Mycena latifolia]|nr:hypothetical protein FB451DRAFT_1430935 [Mycena latifolia]